VIQGGTVWLVSTDGTIGVLTPDSGTFEVKYHAKHYHSWRLGSNSDYMMHPIRPPDVRNIGFNGAVKFPYHKDVIGFQVDVDRCVIFNARGQLLYEGYYDGRRYPLFYNGHDRTVFTADQFQYRTAAVRFPIVNSVPSDRWGPANRIRFVAEVNENNLVEVKQTDAETTYPILDRLGVGFAGVAWHTRREPEPQLDNKLCGYEAHGAHAWYSTYRDYACEKPKENDPPAGEIFEEAEPVVLPRDRVRKRVCVPPELIAPGHTIAQRMCEEVDIVRYHRCLMDFAPGTPLAHQIQGFDLNVCGNFVRVILRNNHVSNNKWYRYVGNVENVIALPKYLPKNFSLSDLFPDGYDQETPQDDSGIPRWWSQYSQTFYVYGSHSRAKHQWMRFSDQRRADIKNVQWLEVADTLADDRRKEENEEKEPDQQTPEYCPIVSGTERILERSAHGFLPEIPFSEWNPYNPDSYGIRQFDVMSVGRGTDGQKRWYYFDGLDWVQGEGVYQDLKNYSHEDLNIIFYKGQESLNMCSPDAHIIPANADRIQCCGDFLIIGLGTNYETRLIFEKDRKLHDFAINGVPEPEQYGQESFVCCDSFFGFTVLELTNRVRSFFYDLEVDDDGTVLKSTRIWQGNFAVDEAPQFTGGCASGCRYYFARQTDKKGIYFYRDAIDKGHAGIEHGHWKFLKELDIKNETNLAPESGCASTGSECSIPCEAADAVTGVQRYFSGVLVSERCEPRQQGYSECTDEIVQITCDGKAVCSSGNYSWEEEVTSANVSLTVTRCDHYANIGDGVCFPDNTFRLEGQSVTVEGKHAAVMGGITTTSGQSYSDGSTTCSSGISTSLTNGWVRSFIEFGQNGYNGQRSFTDDEGVTHNFRLEQCENTLRLRRLSDMVIVDTAEIGASPDFEGLPEVDTTVKWWLRRTCSYGYWSTTTCTLCDGDIDPGFTLPGRERGTVGSYNCHSYIRRGITGRPEDSFCTYYDALTTAPEGYGAAIACRTSSRHTIYKRLTGKIYIPDPYNQTILVVDTGLQGTTCTATENQCGKNCCDTADVRGVCINDIHYTVFQIDGEPERAVLMRGPEYDDVEKKVICSVKEYHGVINGPLTDMHGNLTGCTPDSLWGCGISNTGAVGPCSYVCSMIANGLNCHPDASCANAYAKSVAEYGAVIVDVDWKNHIYRYRVDGFVDQKLELRCCGAYTILFLNDTGYLHYQRQQLEILGKEWHFSGCCGEAAILRNVETGFQRVFIDGEEIDTSDIFQNDPYNTVSNKDYPLHIQCCDDYYLFSHHSENDVEFANEYTPDVKTYQVKGGAGWTGISGIDEWLNEWLGSPDEEEDKPDADECLEQWESTNDAKMVLLDGTVCNAVKGHVRKTDDKSVAVGPARWRTTGVARPAVLDDKGNIKYPAVGEYEFDDPLCPWWEGGTGLSHHEIRANDTGGVLSLMKTLLGSDADMGDRRYIPSKDERIALLEQTIAIKEHRITYLNGLIRSLELQIAGLVYDPIMSALIPSLQESIKGHQIEIGHVTAEIETLRASLVTLHAMPDFTGGYADIKDRYTTNNTWLFGFRLKQGKNIAAAYYKTTFLYNDSRLQDVKCFCDGAFGVFSFTGAGHYWWDTPLIRRKHRYEERKGTNALGNPTYTIYESQFDLYQGLPNPLPHKQHDHEIPQNTEDMTALGDWLQKYVPYGAYVFNRTHQVSGSLDGEMSDYVEPPSNTEHAGVKPPYNAGYLDPKHPYGDFLYFNDRHAPVRYDRALSWEKPFEDHCDHRDFRFGESLDFIRSPFTEGGDRVVTGANGVLHVFDDRQGRMDFNAETLERIV
jgi:hypothetical protein